MTRVNEWLEEIGLGRYAGLFAEQQKLGGEAKAPETGVFGCDSVQVARLGNELFWYIFDGEPKAIDGHIDLDENKPGLGLTINEDKLRLRPIGE